MSTYNSPADVTAIQLARAAHLNNLDAAVAEAFALLPDETLLKHGTVNFAVDTGTANTYLVSLAQAPASYADGLTVVMRPINSNTGASTINVNSLGVKSIKTWDSNDPVAADIKVGCPVTLTYSSVSGSFHIMRGGMPTLGTNVSTFLATPSSANLAAAITDETGTGSLVFSASPTFTGTVTIENLSAAGGYITISSSDYKITTAFLDVLNLSDNTVPFQKDTSTGLNDSPITTNGASKVSINTTDKNYVLHIKETAAYDTACYLCIESYGWGSPHAAGIIFNHGGSYTSTLQTDGTGLSLSSRLVINDNVGVGTNDFDGTPPAGRLVVKGSTADGTTNVLVLRDSGEANILTVDTDGSIVTASTAQIGFKIGLDNWYLGSLSATDPVINFDANDYITYDRSDNDLYYVIDSHTSYKFSKGSLTIKGATSDGSTNALILQDNDAASILTVDTDGNVYFAGNVGMGTGTFGTSAATVLALYNGTAPITAPANTIQVFSVDSSDSKATLGLYLEQAVESIGTFTGSHKVKVKINGTEYWLELDAV